MSYDEHLISMAGGDGDHAPDLDAIQARADKAASGPWRWDENFGDKGDTGTALTNDAGTEIIGAYNWHCCSYRDEPTVDESSAEFIAHARTDVPALLALVREQQAKLDRVLELAYWAGKRGWQIPPATLRSTINGASA